MLLSSAILKNSANYQLRKDTHRLINITEKALHGTPHGTGVGSLSPIVLKTAVLSEPSPPTFARSEIWTVRRRGYNVHYTIGFTPSPKGGTDMEITLPPANAR